MKKRNEQPLALAALWALLGVGTLADPRIQNKAQVAPDLQAEHWYSVKALSAEGTGSAASIEIYIYGEIGFWASPPRISSAT